MKREVNKELLALTLQTIKDNPEHWDQENWHCDTGHCFAGMAEILHMDIDLKLYFNPWGSYISKVYSLASPYIQQFIDDNNITETREYADLVLGLDTKTSDMLYDCDNTLEDLESMVSHIIEHDSLEGYVKAE